VKHWLVDGDTCGETYFDAIEPADPNTTLVLTSVPRETMNGNFGAKDTLPL
jgi:hypothetical protein